MHYSSLLKLSNIFYKQASLIAFPQKSAERIYYWIKDRFNEWLKGNQKPLFIEQEFNIDLTDMPENYRIPRNKSKVFLKLEIAPLSGITESEGLADMLEEYIAVKISYNKNDNANNKYIFKDIKTSIIHELRHYIQFLISKFHGPKNKEFTSPGDEERNSLNIHNFTDKSNVPPFYETPRQAYHLMDLELHPQIADHFIQFKRFVNSVQKEYGAEFVILRKCFDVFVGDPKPNELTNEFFKNLYFGQPNKWKYAVKKLYELVSKEFNL